jgi:hypothetical protein
MVAVARDYTREAVEAAHSVLLELMQILGQYTMALSDRLKSKDAYDIVFCLRHFPGGLDALANELRPLLVRKVVREGLSTIAEKFASPAHLGPRSVTEFEGLADRDEIDRAARDAYERVRYLLSALDIEPTST